MPWTEEMKLAKSIAMKARHEAKFNPEAAKPQPEELQEESIVEAASVEEKPAKPISELATKPDLSKLNDDDKMQSLLNLIKVLPEQYRQNREMLKENVYNLARFVPTDEMLDIVLDGSYVAPQRFPN